MSAGFRCWLNKGIRRNPSGMVTEPESSGLIVCQHDELALNAHPGIVAAGWNLSDEIGV